MNIGVENLIFVLERRGHDSAIERTNLEMELMDGVSWNFSYEKNE